MTLDQTGGPPKRRRDRPTIPDPDLHPAEPGPAMPVKVGQESPNPLPDYDRPEHRPDAETEREHTEKQLDRGLEQTFPASDPVSIQSDR